MFWTAWCVKWMPTTTAEFRAGHPITLITTSTSPLRLQMSHNPKILVETVQNNIFFPSFFDFFCSWRFFLTQIWWCSFFFYFPHVLTPSWYHPPGNLTPAMAMSTVLAFALTLLCRQRLPVVVLPERLGGWKDGQIRTTNIKQQTTHMKNIWKTHEKPYVNVVNKHEIQSCIMETNYVCYYKQKRWNKQHVCF